MYALHAARSLKTHILRDADWDALEQQLLQPNLFNSEEPVAPIPRKAAKSGGRRVRGRAH